MSVCSGDIDVRTSGGVDTLNRETKVVLPKLVYWKLNAIIKQKIQKIDIQDAPRRHLVPCAN